MIVIIIKFLEKSQPIVYEFLTDDPYMPNSVKDLIKDILEEFWPSIQQKILDEFQENLNLQMNNKNREDEQNQFQVTCCLKRLTALYLYQKNPYKSSPTDKIQCAESGPGYELSLLVDSIGFSLQIFLVWQCYFWLKCSKKLQKEQQIKNKVKSKSSCFCCTVTKRNGGRLKVFLFIDLFFFALCIIPVILILTTDKYNQDFQLRSTIFLMKIAYGLFSGIFLIFIFDPLTELVTFSQRTGFNFVAYDPYYLLGVEKNADFKEIKKIYFKLAGEYHPDRNKSPEAQKQFIMIKEAFEQIKQQRGKSIRMDYDKTSKGHKTKYRSVRPNSEDYSDDYRDEKQEMNQDNFQEFAFRAPDSEAYRDMKESLHTMHDINDIKIRVDDVEVPDASKRFGLDEKTVKLKNFSDGGYLFLGVIGIMFGLGLYFINRTHTRMVSDQYQGLVLQMLNANTNDQEIEQEQDNQTLLNNVNQSLSNTREYQEFIKKIEDNKQQSTSKMSRQVPIIRNYVSSAQLQDISDDDEDNL
ncbi:DnaJ domain [Pseudocohnilembus persalinus]|uniref:DnaJ domain n=1 Tax=Pseudocohnilembus persalinus TaxID=266149 RepID=A0A0V0QM90_PSEPJ|nr:DnaJ domain [Pseudocohnilembus persalinus]|eukprot:KRX03290.1 DnaJ domain [Pseudocohnilembus persalinus]